MKTLSYGITLTLIIVLVGCNLPSAQVTPSSPDAIYTQAAETVAAELTRVALSASPTPNIPTNTPVPTNTSTLAPTDTPVPTPTNTPVPCNLARFITDVTIPDNTTIAASQAFTKVWRLLNIGTCTWTSAYTVSLLDGDGMGVSAGYSQSLTNVPIPPGGTVDISVNLIAPASTGTYTGKWSIREPGGQTFITHFIVVIKVLNSVTITLFPVAGESGTISAIGGPTPDYRVGESNVDITHTVEAFLSFGITDIPAKATITEVKIDFKDYTITGHPFESLGVLNGYITTYGSTLEPADFVAGFQSGNTVDWGSVSPLNTLEVSPELKSALQAKIGSSRFQMRLQFAGPNGDAIKDSITFNDPRLIVTYTTP